MTGINDRDASFSDAMFKLLMEFHDNDRRQAEAETPNGSYDHYHRSADRCLWEAIGWASQ